MGSENLKTSFHDDNIHFQNLQPITDVIASAKTGISVFMENALRLETSASVITAKIHKAVRNQCAYMISFTSLKLAYVFSIPHRGDTVK